VEFVVIGGVHDGDHVARWDGAYESVEESGGADTTGEGCEHAGKLLRRKDRPVTQSGGPEGLPVASRAGGPELGAAM
jgi:hypothetical protein